DALDITLTNDNNPYVAPPSSDIVIEYVNTLGYPSTFRNMSAMSINSLYQPWRAILSMINMCLTGFRKSLFNPYKPFSLTGRILLWLHTERRRQLICLYQALDTMADMNIPANDAPAEQAPTVTPPTRTDDQILPSSKWVPIGKSNCILDVQKSQRNLIF
nr:hypothetical protein [Tanacetum cinerariifolium]